MPDQVHHYVLCCYNARRNGVLDNMPVYVSGDVGARSIPVKLDQFKCVFGRLLLVKYGIGSVKCGHARFRRVQDTLGANIRHVFAETDTELCNVHVVHGA